jgi:F-type H+-transporting ATPase subunit a
MPSFMFFSFSKILKYSLLIVSFVFFSQTSMAQHPHEDEDEDQEQPIGDVILHHIADSHEWHFITLGKTHVVLPLPVILYSQENGLDVFSSNLLHHPEKTIKKTNKDTKEVEEGILVKSSKGEYEVYHKHFYLVNGKAVMDFSITKNVASMFVSVLVLLLVFTSIARAYKKTGTNSAPKGMQSFFEPIIVFIRDEIAKPNIGVKYEKYMPYLLTLFFFIWFNNMLGLLPGWANLTGNISITFCLALLTLIITLFSSKGTYWKHIFTPHTPIMLYPIIIPIELIGIITKPFSLMIRLFANVTAGHIIILSLISLIFIFKSVFVSVASIPFAIAMNCLEMFVAILQAYIFTLLSAMYFGQALEEPHHEEAH